MTASYRAVAVYDGECVLCARSIAWVAARDREGRIAFAASGSSTARALLAPLGVDPAAPGSVVLVEDGRLFTRSEAALRMAGHLPAPWRWLTLGAVVPRALRDAAYDLVARHRYRWFGRRGACDVPSPAVRERLLP